MKNENYILLKELPDAPRGTVLNFCGNYNYTNINERQQHIDASIVENNPEWFMKESDYKEKKCEEYQKKLANDIFGKKIKEWQNKQQPIETTPNKPNFDFMEYIKLVKTTEKIAKMLWQSETKLSFLEGQIEAFKLMIPANQGKDEHNYRNWLHKSRFYILYL